MKIKIILAIPVIFNLTACKKNYTCDCGSSGGVFKTYEIKDTKKKAEQKCNDYNKEYQIVPFSETECTLN